MSASVLFDLPGPKARRRHRIIGLVGVIVLAGLLGGFIFLMYQNDLLTADQWEVFVTPQPYMLAIAEGIGQTLAAAVVAILFAALLGLVFGLGKIADTKAIQWPSWIFVEFFRAVPVLILIYFIFTAYGSGDGGIGPFWSLVIALSLYNGAVLAEVLRAGINSVPKGQAEAAYAIGMRKTQVMREVLVPQAVRIMLPAIISQLVVALKDTSLGFAINAFTVSFVLSKQITGEFRNQLAAGLVLAAIYIILNIAVAKIATYGSDRLIGTQTQGADDEAEKETQATNAGA